MLEKDQDIGAICFIHGWGFDSRVMEGLVAELRPCWNVRLIDMPGYRNNRPVNPPGDIENIADSLAHTIQPNTVLVGWSLGGMAAIKIAHIMRERIRAIILLASTPCFVKKKDWPHGMEPYLIDEMTDRISTEIEEVLQEFAVLTARGDVSPKQTLRELKLLLKSNSADPYALLTGLNILRHTDLRNEYSELKCHVMMISGEEDQLITAGTGSASREIQPLLKLNKIPATGHAPFISKKKEAVEMIDKYLRSL